MMVDLFIPVQSDQHATITCERDLDLIWVKAAKLEKKTGTEAVDEYSESADDYETAWAKLKSADGVIVPGVFGNRYVKNLLHIIFF